MRAVIEAEDVAYTYPDGTPGVASFTEKVYEGERVVLIGANGSGKSTLRMLFAGLLRPSRGRLKVFGKEVTGKNAPFFRRRIGILFQNPDDFLFNPTVMDELMYTPLHMGITPEKARNMARRHARIFGIEALLEKPPFRLSGGEKKRVALACVLMLNPPLLLLDEPTTNVDAKTRRAMLDVLRDYRGTLVIATHETHYVRDLAERVFILSQERRILRTGGPDLLEDEDVLAEAGL